MTIQNLPFIYLIWITIGVVLILIGIFMLASYQNSIVDKNLSTQRTQVNEELEGILSYFLQEEEKKNQGFRDMLENYTKEIGSKVNKDTRKNTQENINSNNKQDIKDDIMEITALADQGLEVEEIAKRLGKGIGEVNLILSLYKMR